jgi:glycosyltransferase involved in cell wall biosynthesis
MRPLGWAKSRAQVRAWLREADAMLFPSRLEGMPLAVLEAMGVGLPVVAARAASLPEVVIDGETGLLCPTDDVHGFVTAIRRLRNDPLLWQSMQRASRAVAEHEYTEERAMADYLRLYAEVLAR